MPSCVEVSGFVWMAGIARSFRVSSGKGLFLADGVFSERRNVDTPYILPSHLALTSCPTSSPHIFQTSRTAAWALSVSRSSERGTNERRTPSRDHPPWATDT